MRLLVTTIALGLAATCYADIITLKNGRIINGTYLGGTARQIKVEVGDNIQTLDVGDIARIEFSNGGYTSARDTPRDDGRPTLRRARSRPSASRSPLVIFLEIDGCALRFSGGSMDAEKVPGPVPR